MPLVRTATSIADVGRYVRDWEERRRRAAIAESIELARYVVESFRDLRETLAPSLKEQRRLAKLAAVEHCGDCGRELTKLESDRRPWGDTPETTCRRCVPCYDAWWRERDAKHEAAR